MWEEVGNITGPPGSSVDVRQCYPIGTVYMTITTANPSVLFGFGTWVKIHTLSIIKFWVRVA